MPNELKKYVKPALKDYRNMLKMANPDEEIRRIIKIFEGNKSVDNWNYN